MALSSFRNAYIAFEQQHKKLLNTYIVFIKGWIKPTTSIIRKDITDKLMQNSSGRVCFDCVFRVILINESVLDLDEYQELIESYLEAPHMQKQSINLLNGLKNNKIYDPNDNKFPKLHPFFLDEKKCYTYFTFFGKTCKSPSD